MQAIRRQLASARGQTNNHQSPFNCRFVAPYQEQPTNIAQGYRFN